MKNIAIIRKNIVIGAVIISGIMIGLAGCATFVPIKSVRPPTIDTSTIKRLAVKPFENKSGVSGLLATQLTQYIHDNVMRQITDCGMFTIVAVSDPNADGIFTGEIRNITSNDSQEQMQKKDKEGNAYTETWYKRDVTLEFQYSIISTRTSMPIGVINKNGSASSSNQDLKSVTDTLTLAKNIADSQLKPLQKDIVPTIVSTNRKLMNETSKDKAIKEQMKTAKTLVRTSNYPEAIRLYDEIESEYGSIAARVNANILREAVESDTAARSKLSELFNDKSGLAEKAVKGVVDSLNSKLPSGSNIILMKTNSTERSMLDNVVEQLTRDLVQGKKLLVVDRSNQALINAEQQYQMSGNVSDNSIVSIGQQLGAQYIALCWISGEMSTRRFNTRVLNVETSQIVDQKDFEI